MLHLCVLKIHREGLVKQQWQVVVGAVRLGGPEALLDKNTPTQVCL